MIGFRLPAPRLNHALGAATVAFAGLAVWPWVVPPIPAIRPPVAVGANAAASTLAPLPPLASYAAIVERPLFAPSRRPPPDAVPSAPSVESRYRLLGIVITGPKKKAFVADGTRRVEIAEGETLDGWPVKEIDRDSVRLFSPAGEVVLRLNRKNQ